MSIAGEDSGINGGSVPPESTAAASDSTAMQKRKGGPWPAKKEELEDWEGPGLKRIKKRLEGMKEEELPEVEPLDALGTTVKASIVAKFEHGYLLRVQVGREKLHGVLYHAPPPDSAYPLLPPRVNTTGLALQDGKVILKRAPKKKVVIRKEVLKRDRNAPRPARTGYNFFFSEARTRDRELNPGRDDQERSAAIGEQWRKMTAEDRQPFLERAQRDKERYHREMATYQERLTAQALREMATEPSPEPDARSPGGDSASKSLQARDLPAEVSNDQAVPLSRVTDDGVATEGMEGEEGDRDGLETEGNQRGALEREGSQEDALATKGKDSSIALVSKSAGTADCHGSEHDGNASVPGDAVS